MENNDYEETQDEELQDTATDAEQVEEGQEETKDWKAEALKYKAIAERKNKKLQSSESKKPNTEQGGSTKEHSYLYAQGYSFDEVEFIEKSSKTLESTLLEASKDPIVQAKIEQTRQEERVKANVLPPSGGSAPTPREKTMSNMTEEEHRALWEEKSKNAING